MDSSDDDDVIDTIRLQKDLISESQSLHDLNAAEILVRLSSASSKSDEQPSSSDVPDNSSSVVADGENPYNSALAANIEYDNMLCKVENNLKDLITDCKRRLAELSMTRETKKSFGKSVSTGRSNGLYVFGAPYFKDENFFPCPPNIDAKKKRDNGEMIWVTLPPVRWWTPEHTKKLVSAVKKTALAACKEDARNHKNALQRQLNSLSASGHSMEAKKVAVEIESFDVDKFAQSKLSDKLANSDHDWLKISATVLDGKHSAAECRGFWYNYLHPKFYKGTWTDKETERLKVVAEENGCQDWETIAEKLGTKRSGYQCFAQYHNALTSSTKQKWSEEEDARLKALVAKYQIGSYIPWAQVSQQILGRSQTQVYNRWIYTLDPSIKKGRFSIQEDVIILCGVRKWGEDFQRIAQFMPNRTPPQIRMRYHNYTSTLNAVRFSPDDDEMIINLVKQYGHDWKKISEHFPGQNRIKVRHRYETVQRFLTQNPGRPLSHLGSRRVCRENINEAHRAYWNVAERLLSGGSANTAKHCSTSLLVTKTVSKTRRKKKEPSAMDTELLAYFQESYMSRPLLGITRSFDKENVKYVKQMALLLDLLGAKLVIPSDEVLEEDSDFDEEDRKMLRALRSLNSTPDFVLTESSPSSLTTTTSPGHSFSFLDIDCAPQSPSSVSITLPFDSALPPPDIPAVNIKQEVVEVEDELSATFREPYFGCLKYLCPPNHATMTGFRSVLYRKERLLETVSKSDHDPLRLSYLDGDHPEPFGQARKMWDDRLFFLFALPNLLSKIEPPEPPESKDPDNSSVAPPPTNEVGPAQSPPLENSVVNTDNPSTAKKRKLNDGQQFTVVTVPGTPCGSKVVSAKKKKKGNNVVKPASITVSGAPSDSEPSTVRKPRPKRRNRNTDETTVATRTVQTRSSKRKNPPEGDVQ